MRIHATDPDQTRRLVTDWSEHGAHAATIFDLTIEDARGRAHRRSLFGESRPDATSEDGFWLTALCDDMVFDLGADVGDPAPFIPWQRLRAVEIAF